VGRRTALVTLSAVFALAGCGWDATGDVEAIVEDDYAEFPSEAQPEGTRPWPEGRFTGDCAEDESGGFLCFYEDELERQGYACFDGEARPQVTSAAGAYAPDRRFDHDGRALPPDNRCPDIADS
jgi:hypothetical protein